MHLDWHTANFTTKLSRWSSHASTCALVSGLLAISPLAASEVHAYYGFISSACRVRNQPRFPSLAKMASSSLRVASYSLERCLKGVRRPVTCTFGNLHCNVATWIRNPGRRTQSSRIHIRKAFIRVPYMNPTILGF